MMNTFFFFVSLEWRMDKSKGSFDTFHNTQVSHISKTFHHHEHIGPMVKSFYSLHDSPELKGSFGFMHQLGQLGGVRDCRVRAEGRHTTRVPSHTLTPALQTVSEENEIQKEEQVMISSLVKQYLHIRSYYKFAC